MGWRKKVFGNYFDKMENFELHRIDHRLLHAPTVKITRLIQEDKMEWLDEIGESLAFKWFKTLLTQHCKTPTLLLAILVTVFHLVLSPSGDTPSEIR
jgi:hypothetical protein